MRVNSLGRVVRDDQRVLDADTAVAREVHPGLHGDGHASGQGTRAQRPDARRLVDLQAHAVPEAVREVLGVPRRGDDLAAGRVDRDDVGADRERRPSGGLRGRDQLVDLPLPVGRVPEDDGAGHVGVVAVDGRAEVQLQEVAVAQHGGGRAGGAGSPSWRRWRRSSRRTAPRTEGQHAGVSSRPTWSSVRPGRSAPSAASSASARSATAQARRSGLDLVVVLDRALRLDRPADEVSSGRCLRRRPAPSPARPTRRR